MHMKQWGKILLIVISISVLMMLLLSQTTETFIEGAKNRRVDNARGKHKRKDIQTKNVPHQFYLDGSNGAKDKDVTQYQSAIDAAKESAIHGVK